MKTILQLNISSLESFITCRALVTIGYQKTHRKWWITYAGSKGYLSHIEINCEGCQPEQTNIIDLIENTGSCGRLKNKIVVIKWSNETGVIIEQ